MTREVHEVIQLLEISAGHPARLESVHPSSVLVTIRCQQVTAFKVRVAVLSIPHLLRLYP